MYSNTTENMKKKLLIYPVLYSQQYMCVCRYSEPERVVYV